MKLLTLFFLLVFVNTAFAQQKNNETLLRVKDGIVLLQKNINQFDFDNVYDVFEKTFYFVVQFKNDVYKSEVFKNNQLNIHTKLDKNIYLASSSSKELSWEALGVLSVGYLPESLKLNVASFSQPTTKNDVLIVSFYGISRSNIEAKIKGMGIGIKSHFLTNESSIAIAVNEANALALSKLPYITYIEKVTTQSTPLNNISKQVHGITSVTNANGRNLSGRNVAIGHGDLGKPIDHIDLFTNSKDNYNSTIGYFHGNHTHGIQSGSGIINEKHIGVAPKSPTINAFYTDIILNTPAYVNDFDMVATNNSYHSSQAGCIGNRLYNGLSVFTDAQTVAYPTNLHVFAAGNDGRLTCSPYPFPFGTIKSGFQTAKNVITVGNLNTDNYLPASVVADNTGSSRGPIYDGRLKPEIIARGNDVISTVPVDFYDFTTGGTSMAAPVVTGAVALLQERHRQLNGTTAKSDLIKILLCNSSDDLGNYGPDFSNGFGMLNVRKSMEALEGSRYFNGTIAATNNTATHNITVPPNARRVKVMLYWIDKEGSTVAAQSLVNNLDLTLTTPAAVVHKPYILDHTPANVNNTATEGRDSINNIEQCIIENPTAGVYVAKVDGYDVTIPNQKYVVAYEL